MFKVLKATKDEHKQTIVDFQVLMAKETEDLALDPSIVSKGVSAVFDESSKGTYYVALDEDDNCIGSLLTMNEWSDWRCKNVLWIHSVFIVKEMRGRGVFKSMYSHLKSKVEVSSDLAGLRLYVDRTNVKAQSVYQKIGMSNEHYELYEWLR